MDGVLNMWKVNIAFYIGGHFTNHRTCQPRVLCLETPSERLDPTPTLWPALDDGYVLSIEHLIDIQPSSDGHLLDHRSGDFINIAGRRGTPSYNFRAKSDRLLRHRIEHVTIEWGHDWNTRIQHQPGSMHARFQARNPLFKNLLRTATTLCTAMNQYNFHRTSPFFTASANFLPASPTIVDQSVGARLCLAPAMAG